MKKIISFLIKMSKKVIEVKDYKEAVELIISNNSFESIITGSPGTGKTRDVPTQLALHGKKVFVVIPTKLAVISAKNYAQSDENPRLNNRIKERLGKAANSIIDYHNTKISIARSYLYGSKEIIKPDSLIVYCTPGHIKKVLIDQIKYGADFPSAKTMAFCDYIVFDEVHEETLEMDFSIKYSRYIATIFGEKNAAKIIKMSATANINMSGQKYSLIENDLEMKKRECYYFDELYNQLDIPLELDSEEPKFKDILDFIPYVVNSFISDLFGTIPNGMTMLVFLPGKKEIQRAGENIKTFLTELMDKNTFEVLHAHSKVNSYDLNYLMEKRPHNIIFRVILSTNICETSVTIPDVSYVFDSMLEKISYRGNNDVIQIKTDFISKKSAIQRAGRTGRTTNGVVIRCCFIKLYNKLKDKTESEIKRLPITNDILKAMQANITLSVLLPEISAREMREHLRELERQCCIEKNGDFHKITNVGEFASSIPLTVKNAVFLRYWIMNSEEIFPGIVLATVIEMMEVIFPGLSPKEQSDIPLGTILNPLLSLWKISKKQFKPHDRLVRKFSYENGFAPEGIFETLKRINEITNILNLHYDNLNTDFFMFDVEDVFQNSFSILKRFNPKMILIEGGKYIKETDFEKYEEKRTNVKKYVLSSSFLSFGKNKPAVIYAISFANSKFGAFSQEISLWIPEEYVFNDSNSLNESNELEDESDIDDESLDEEQSDSDDFSDSDDNSSESLDVESKYEEFKNDETVYSEKMISKNNDLNNYKLKTDDYNNENKKLNDGNNINENINTDETYHVEGGDIEEISIKEEEHFL